MIENDILFLKLNNENIKTDSELKDGKSYLENLFKREILVAKKFNCIILKKVKLLMFKNKFYRDISILLLMALKYF